MVNGICGLYPICPDLHLTTQNTRSEVVTGCLESDFSCLEFDTTGPQIGRHTPGLNLDNLSFVSRPNAESTTWVWPGQFVYCGGSTNITR